MTTTVSPRIEAGISAEVDAIVAALATVAGIEPYSSSPDQATAGAAWPIWTQTRYTGGKLRRLPVSDYDVVVILDAAYASTSLEQAHGLRDAVGAALLKIGDVATVEPVLVSFGDGADMPALRYRTTPRIC